MAMSKKQKIATIVTASVLLIAALVFAAGLLLKPEGVFKNSKLAVQSGSYKYVIKYENDKVSVFECKGDKYLYDLDVDATMLPEQDRNQLEKGLYVKDKNALRRTIEDLTG